MTPSKEALIKSLNSDLSQEITVRMRLTEDPRSIDINEFCTNLARLAPRIKIQKDDDEAGKLPAIGIGPRIDYCGVPSGNDTAPFLKALTALDRKTDSIPKDIAQRLHNIHPAAEITLFIAPSCRFCPGVLDRIIPLPLETEGVRLTIIDTNLFGDVAEIDKVRSVPTVLVDGQYRWTGGVQLTQLCAAVENRDPSKLGKPALKRLITDGGAYDLARMMLDSGRLFPAFIELLVDENFTVRLAAMVTVEEIAAMDIVAARAVIGPLWKRYHQSSDSVKGDIMYILGELRSPATLSDLRSIVASETNPEIKEAAWEAIEKIEKT